MRKRQLAVLLLLGWIVTLEQTPKAKDHRAALSSVSMASGVLYNAAVSAGKGLKVIL